jgi:hypothetical protein
MQFVQRSIAILAIAILLPWTSKGAGPRTNYAPNAVLSAKQLDQVVALAHKCGMSNVTEVITFHFSPGTNRGIRARGDEIINGRSVTYKTLAIWTDLWSSMMNPPAGRNVVWIGPFCAEPADLLQNHTEFAFKTHAGEARVQISDNVALETADRIVEAFAARRIRFADESVHDQVEPGNLTPRGTRSTPNYDRPTWIGRHPTMGLLDSGNVYWISFYGRLDQLQVELTGEKVKILSIMHIVS